MKPIPKHTTLTINNFPTAINNDAYVIITNPRNEAIKKIKQSFYYGVVFTLGLLADQIIKAVISTLTS